MIYEYLKENYEPAEPIFFSDIDRKGYSKSALSQQLKKLCDEEKLVKYENGIYYIPKKTRLHGIVGPNADVVARYKYISRRGRIHGFYSGGAFANQLGISTQVPSKVEIVSNNIAAKIREVSIGKRIFIVRKAAVEVNEENVHVLQMLDLLKNLDVYMEGNYEEAHERFKRYIELYHVTRGDVDSYIREYPVNVFKNYYELRLEDVFTQRG